MRLKFKSIATKYETLLTQADLTRWIEKNSIQQNSLQSILKQTALIICLRI